MAIAIVPWHIKNLKTNDLVSMQDDYLLFNLKQLFTACLIGIIG